VEPSSKFVYGYGNRNYLVTAIKEEESYSYECSKFDKDGTICCHIMRVMVRMGVKSIPERYILKRWTQQAIGSDADQVQSVLAPVELVARGMPLNSEKTLRLTNTTTVLAALAAEGCTCDENYVVLEKHIKEIQYEFGEIKKRKMANRQATAYNQQTSGPIPSAANTSATEGAQNGLGAIDPTQSSLRTTGFKTSLSIMVYFILVRLCLIS
jgi:hypothetical protein